MKKPTLGIVGAGRVGNALARALTARGWRVTHVWSRTTNSAQELADEIHATRCISTSELAQADLVFVTVSDSAIETVTNKIAEAGGWRAGQGVVHCAGAIEIDALAKAAQRGATIGGFHPMQTFATVEAALAALPGSFFALEGDGLLKKWLPAIANSLDGRWQWLKPGTRPLYHAAGVFASNYVVTLFGVGMRLLQQAGFDSETSKEALLPLTQKTVQNLAQLGVPNALTGPIQRGDATTISRHLDALYAQAPDLADAYRVLAAKTLPLAHTLTSEQREKISNLLAT